MNQKTVFQQITILAPGLLGASLGMAVHRFSLAGRVQVWARRAESRLVCAEQPWCDRAFADPLASVRGSDLVVICTPVDRIVELVEQCAEELDPGCVVTDVGSTKSRICRQCAATMPDTAFFVGAHPMAGSEKSGLGHARPDLFDRCACLVTPLEETPDGAVDLVVRFWRALGMEVTTLSPEKHDEIVAHISHLPHLLASVLCRQLSRKPLLWQAFAGKGFADTTRIAAGSPDIWRSIFEENREELLRAINGFESELAEMRSLLHNKEWPRIRQLLEKGKQYREELQ